MMITGKYSKVVSLPKKKRKQWQIGNAGSIYYIDDKYSAWKNMPENVRPSKPWGNF